MIEVSSASERVKCSLHKSSNQEWPERAKRASPASKPGAVFANQAKQTTKQASSKQPTNKPTKQVKQLTNQPTNQASNSVNKQAS